MSLDKITVEDMSHILEVIPREVMYEAFGHLIAQEVNTILFEILDQIELRTIIENLGDNQGVRQYALSRETRETVASIVRENIKRRRANLTLVPSRPH